MRKLVATFLISILTLSITSAVAASPSAKPTPKAGADAATKATKKPVVKKKKKKKKKKTEKKVVKKKKKKKKLPPLQPVLCFGKSWPPSRFTQNGEVFAKIPTAAQLQCEASDNYKSAKVLLKDDLKKCDDFACGAVTVASETGCTWW